MYYSFKNNGLEYEEIKKLLLVKPKKELKEYIVTKGIIKQEYAIDYDVSYYRANYRRYEKDMRRFKKLVILNLTKVVIILLIMNQLSALNQLMIKK